jgi:regulator of protease activity HflC (stomatin/prohibitin superfamily)
LHFVIPFAHNVHQVNTQVQAHSFQEIDAASEELQTVKLTGKVNFALDARHAADLYQNVGLGFAGKLLDRSNQEILKWDGKLPQVTGGASPFVSLSPR